MTGTFLKSFDSFCFSKGAHGWRFHVQTNFSFPPACMRLAGCQTKSPSSTEDGLTAKITLHGAE
jgi:hypothetical protein